MSSLSNSVNIVLKATDKYSSEMKRFRSDMDRSSKSAKNFASSMSRLAPSIAGFATVVGGAALTAGIARFNTLLDRGDDIRQLSLATGESAESIQILGNALTLAGGQGANFGDQLLEFNQRLGEATSLGTGPFIDALKMLKIQLVDLIGLDAGEQFKMIAEAMQGLSEAEQITVLDRLFGGGGRQMLPMFSGGAEGYEEFVEMAEKMGTVFNDDMLDLINELKMLMEELGITIAQAFDGQILKTAKGFFEWIESRLLGMKVLQDNGIWQWINPFQIPGPEYLSMQAGLSDTLGGMFDFVTSRGTAMESQNFLGIDTDYIYGIFDAWREDNRRMLDEYNERMEKQANERAKRREEREQARQKREEERARREEQRRQEAWQRMLDRWTSMRETREAREANENYRAAARREYTKKSKELARERRAKMRELQGYTDLVNRHSGPARGVEVGRMQSTLTLGGVDPTKQYQDKMLQLQEEQRKIEQEQADLQRNHQMEMSTLNRNIDELNDKLEKLTEDN